MRNIVAAICALVVAAPSVAAAADLGYEPQAVSVSLEAGESTDIGLTVTLNNVIGWKTYFTWFVSDASGSLPLSWITADPVQTMMNAEWDVEDAVVTVSVPPGTPAGVYSSTLWASAKGAHSTADSETGWDLTVTVVDPCLASPTFVGLLVTPATLTPPNGTLRSVTLSGQAVVPAGCRLLDVSYALDDEYDVYDSADPLLFDAAGFFSEVFTLQATRDPADPDGRWYDFTVTATDEAGIASDASLNVVVPLGVGGVENACKNGKDDDGDGLMDCADPDCADRPFCL